MNIYYDIEMQRNPNVNPLDFSKPYKAYSEDGLKIGPKDRIPAEEKRAKHLAEYNEKKEAHEADIIADAALHPATARIVCLQYSRDEEEEIHIIDGDEERILISWWELCKQIGLGTSDKNKWWNWTGKNKPDNFDISMLLRRSWANGIKPPYIDKFCWQSVSQEFLRWESWQDGHMNLERAAKSLGIEVEEFTTVCGANFALHYLGDDEELKAEAIRYAKQDVRLIREIKNKTRYE